MSSNDTDKSDTDKIVELNNQETEQVVGGNRIVAPIQRTNTGNHGGETYVHQGLPEKK